MENIGHAVESTFYDRLLEEKKELEERRARLVAFLEAEKDKVLTTLEPFQLSLLNIQAQAMLTYSQVLTERISWLNNPPQSLIP